MLPAPTAPSEGYAGVRNLDPSNPKALRPVLDPGSPAQASLPIVFIPARRTGLPAMFGGPSWDDHFCVPLCPRRSEEQLEPRRAKGRSSLPAPLPASPVRARKLSPLPAGGDRYFGHLPHHRAVSGIQERLEPLPRSPDDNAPARESRKAKKLCSSLWITGISGTTVGTLSQSRVSGSESRLGHHPG